MDRKAWIILNNVILVGSEVKWLFRERAVYFILHVKSNWFLKIIVAQENASVDVNCVFLHPFSVRACARMCASPSFPIQQSA